MSVFLRTAEFDAWLKALRDPIGKARILARLRAAELDHFGDHASVGDAVFELRIHIGSGLSRVLLAAGQRDVLVAVRRRQIHATS
jgi:putative addiction module killer protein